MKESTEGLIAKLTGAGLIGMSTVFFIAISSGAPSPGILALGLLQERSAQASLTQ